MEYVILNNGFQIPKVGLGTYNIPRDKFTQILNLAYSYGYRLFDTAWKYNNEKDIGKWINNSDELLNNVIVSTMFSSSALYVGEYKYGIKSIFNLRNFKSIKDIISQSFDNLKVNCIDIFLIHWPYPNYLKVYRALAQLYEEGRIKAIGVASFTEGHINSLQEVSDVVPAINQFEISPLNTQKNLIRFCQNKGITVEAMSTFSHFRSNEPRLEIFNNSVLKQIASIHKRTVAQVVLRWLIQQDIIVIPKTWDSNYLKENISIFDFILSDEEMKMIDSLDQGKCLNYNPYAPHILKSIPNNYRNNNY